MSPKLRANQWANMHMLVPPEKVFNFTPLCLFLMLQRTICHKESTSTCRLHCFSNLPLSKAWDRVLVLFTAGISANLDVLQVPGIIFLSSRRQYSNNAGPGRCSLRFILGQYENTIVLKWGILSSHVSIPHALPGILIGVQCRTDSQLGLREYTAHLHHKTIMLNCKLA